MEVHKGDRVLVNLAPFIGSQDRSRKSVVCNVVDTDAATVSVCPEPPYRQFVLKVSRAWIEGRADKSEREAALA